MKVSIRKFKLSDIPNKVKWINDPRVNQYLHYDLPLERDKTEKWFLANENRTDRYDAVIECDDIPIGLIGLLSIDETNHRAELYIAIGEPDYFRKGIAKQACDLLLKYAFETFKLTMVCLYVECGNEAAIHLYEKIGFHRLALQKNHVMSNGRIADRFYYELYKADYQQPFDTPILPLGEKDGNRFYIKREDLFPYSFGGNKARKAFYYFADIDSGGYDRVITYGSSSSNHCRAVANMSAQRGIPCVIIGPEESSEPTYNSRIVDLFKAERKTVPVLEVHDAIEQKIAELQDQGYKPYFISGGGHGILGTQAYVDCYNEIKKYEKKNGIFFDYIFLASGTGTTQAGLVCGQLLSGDKRKIVGISIARKVPYGRDVVRNSIREFLDSKGIRISDSTIDNATEFDDSYICGGYGKVNGEILENISHVLAGYGIAMDSTYTGKAYTGMLEYIKKNGIKDKKVLFIHTGGAPLFFDDLAKMMEGTP